MELDDLRRQWQTQPVGPATSPESTEQTLRAMLAQTPDTPLSHLKRNARRNLSVAVLILVINLRAVLGQGSAHGVMNEPLMRGLLLTGFLLLFASLIWQLWLFRQMERTGDNLRQQLSRLTGQVKQVLQLRQVYGVGWYGLMLLAALYLKRHALLSYLQADGQQLNHALIVGAGLLAAVGMGAWLYRAGQKQRQRRYGQYLDQLEATLRELE
ncbi:hypothetical protein [Hymenobacter jeollabukensis]|uniref:Uncharacterized protein n=1 Tax=Hymenobacter jeollabukensis TaxID=2025313 RepID=A0A5R8WR99_9BACT|nr:hypothetical protein [Hymenobacter jeollabukensis]TLM93278.1 hypothetical protein FDY95_11710 [Hymenobacter jeollabukensis]